MVALEVRVWRAVAKMWWDGWRWDWDVWGWWWVLKVSSLLTTYRLPPAITTYTDGPAIEVSSLVISRCRSWISARALRACEWRVWSGDAHAMLGA